MSDPKLAYRVQTDRIDKTVDHLLKAMEHQQKALRWFVISFAATWVALICVVALVIS